MSDDNDIISASEIGRWAYCHRAWFLAREGAVNRNVEALTRGERAHQQHGRQVARAHTLHHLALALIALAAAVFLLAVIGFLI